MIKAVFFDLFFTLIQPDYPEKDKESDVLSMSIEQWEQYAEAEDCYRERALGKIRSGMEIIERITERIPKAVTTEQKADILRRREQRMKNAIESVPQEYYAILEQLKQPNQLKQSNQLNQQTQQTQSTPAIHSKIKLGLISNADVIDTNAWDGSLLASYFDDAVFSWQVGMLKPEVSIYELAMRRMGVLPQECIFIGDGGSKELAGARAAGMRTIFTEALIKKGEKERTDIELSSNYHITRFEQILDYIRLLDVYILGGSPCSGKSTVAEQLTAQFGFTYFKVDDFLNEYLKRGAKDQKPYSKKVAAMTPEEIWMREPELQNQEELALYREMFPYVLEDLLKSKTTPDIVPESPDTFAEALPIVTEGAAYLPELMHSLGIDGDHYICMTPSMKFQWDHYEKRPWVPYVLEGCSDKKKAFENWMERDILFANEVKRQSDEFGYHSIVVDGTEEEEKIYDRICHWFQLKNE